MTYYVVKLTCYQHNTGRADNGNKACVKRFDDLKSAKGYVNKLMLALKDKHSEESHELANEFVYDGYCESFVGIYEITEKKVG